MYLSQFKNGDIIHRTEPLAINNSFGLLFRGPEKDFSFIEEPLEILDFLSGIVFIKDTDGILYKLPIERWGDDCWDYYPVTRHEILNPQEFEVVDGHYRKIKL